MPIKSAHITNYFHKDSGGISTAYRSLLAAAERHRRKMFLIVPGESDDIETISDYTKIYYVRAMKSPLFDKRYRLIMPWQYMPVKSELRRILMSEMPDMIEIRDKYALSAFGPVVRINKFSELNRPMLISYSSERMDDNLASFLSKGPLSRWFAKRYIGNYIIPSYDFHLTNSPYTAEEFDRSTLRKHNPRRMEWFTNLCWRSLRSARVSISERIRICPSGVDIEGYSPERKSATRRREMTGRSGIPEDSIVLLYAGRISPEKNVALLVDLMGLLARDAERDFRLLVAGGGPKAEWLQAQTEKRFPNKIIQLGHIDKKTLADQYANADIFIHPNPKEPFGIGPLEAMASGLPVVAPNSGGVLSYATNENSWLVDPTAEAFVGAINEIVADPHLRSQKVEKGFVAVRNNSRAEAADRMLAAYDELYEDFRRRNELYTDRRASARYDFRPLLDQADTTSNSSLS